GAFAAVGGPDGPDVRTYVRGAPVPVHPVRRMSTFNAPAPPTPAAHHETGKKRASRISLDYFKHPTLLERGKNWLSLLLLLAAVVYVGYALAGNHKTVSRGPVAGVHAAWDNNCQAC